MTAGRPDCRRCAFYTPRDLLVGHLRRWAEEWARRRGRGLIGLCELLGRPLTEPVEGCPHFSERGRPPRRRSLEELLGGGGG